MLFLSPHSANKTKLPTPSAQPRGGRQRGVEVLRARIRSITQIFENRREHRKKPLSGLF